MHFIKLNIIINSIFSKYFHYENQLTRTLSVTGNVLLNIPIWKPDIPLMYQTDFKNVIKTENSKTAVLELSYAACTSQLRFIPIGFSATDNFI